MAERPKLLVLGSGFGGYSLLPSAVTGTVELRSILEPTRRRLLGVRVVEGLAESID
jgi:NADH dehydrogenase FAD-containing subunit